jgi:hypothetical protein
MSEKPSAKPVPALATTGIRQGQIGTALWAVIALVAFVFPDFCEGIGLPELRQIAVAGVILGLIGTTHVTLRAKRLNLLP